ncbi:hypothetical protein LX81_00371 [Palleronia aestuarii]|uniref:Uncharacterized protein n=1 Tax=Palleronia aestuarii TaxID=568105 RepID=A0A2W7NP38_9RHOB|nr:hypothetical protein [Palleronia aestuarii]PZX19907.1 hypothetical protein LX81_00371 [Palleronia aestuarii]
MDTIDGDIRGLTLVCRLWAGRLVCPGAVALCLAMLTYLGTP